MAKKPTKIKRSAIINKSEIARLLNLTPQYIGQLMNGKRHTDERIEQIHKVIQKELKYLSTNKAA
jgi:transcriptional regulator with XRE-family HTH domain